jgi:hypothetical protein
VGSILEYSYVEEFSHFVEPPIWDIQGDLFVRREHFVWNPERMIRGEHSMLTKVAHDDILPAGTKVENEKKSYQGVFDLGGRKLETYEVTATDVPPTPDEQFTPPISSLRYSVRFAYVHAEEGQFWMEEGSYWSKNIDHFMPSNEKLRLIYAAVMALENTEFTRDHTKSEDKASGHAKVKEANDVLELKEGTPNALTILFVAMARSAGMEAYAMYVPDRTTAVFSSHWLTFDQFSDFLAFVKVDGKGRFFDPGSRYCPFGQLAWWHEQVEGVRQNAAGVVLALTPAGAQDDNVTRRHAALRLEAKGDASGEVEISYTGAEALHWRRNALRNDDQGFRQSLKKALQELLPPGLVVEVTAVDHVQEYEQPLVVHASVSGGLASATGKRLLLPVDVFSARDKSPFPEGHRVYPIDFQYAERVEDIVDIQLPLQMTIEASVEPSALSVRNDGSYKLSVTAADGVVVTHREFGFGGVFMPASEYDDLHRFFAKMDTEDHAQVVLTATH